MNITLEQVDQVRERCNVSYQKAKEVLEQTEGDVLEAIVLLEDEKPKKEKIHQSASDFGNDVIKQLKELLKTGNVNRIVVEKNDTVVMNIPVTVGALGALLLTSATVIGLIAALATGCVIKIHKEDGEIINVNDRASAMMKKTKAKAEEVFETAKQHVKDANGDHEASDEETDEDVNEETEDPYLKVVVTEEDDDVNVEVTEE